MVRAKRNRLEVLKEEPSVKDDKRVFCRFSLDNVPVRLKDLKVGEKTNGVCRDIGGGGAGIECSGEIRPRTPLELWFELPDGFEPLHLLGKVAWVRPSGSLSRFGVAFDRARLMSISRILRVLS